MPSPVLNVTLLSQAIQYTGSNSADIDSQVPNVSIVSEINGVLTLDFNGNHLTVNTTDWVIFDVNGTNVLPDILFVNEKDCVPTCAELEAVALQVATAMRAIGISLVPALDPTDSAVVPVTLQPAMPDTAYTAFASSASDLAINSVTVVDTDTVNVLVQNVGLTTISGASVMVHAID